MYKLLIVFIFLNAFNAFSQFDVSKEIDFYLKVKHKTLLFNDTIKLLDTDIPISKVDGSINVFVPDDMSSNRDYGSISGFFYKHQGFLIFVCLGKINLKNNIDNQLISITVFNTDLKSCYIFQVLNEQVLCYSSFKSSVRNWGVNDYYIQHSSNSISGLNIEKFINNLNQSISLDSQIDCYFKSDYIGEYSGIRDNETVFFKIF